MLLVAMVLAAQVALLLIAWAVWRVVAGVSRAVFRWQVADVQAGPFAWERVEMRYWPAGKDGPI